MGEAQVWRWLDFSRLLHQALMSAAPLRFLAGEGLFCVLETEQIHSKNQYTNCTNLESQYLQNVPTTFSRHPDTLIPLSLNPRQKAVKSPRGHLDRKNALLAGLNCWEGAFFISALVILHTIGNLAISIYRLRKMPKRSGHQITHPTAKWRTRAQNSLYGLMHCRVTVS